MTATHTTFNGAIPEKYDRFLGPMWFDPYAVDLAARLPERPGLRVLELACGTGIATRRIRDRLAPDAALVATDLNPPMLEWARRKLGEDGQVEFRVVDASQPPFEDASFDVVVCQFAMMFLPDKAQAVREIRRVLAPGGLFLFSTWDSLAHNDLARVAHEVCTQMFHPGEPPRFWLVPYGLYDIDAVARVLEAEGLTDIRVDRVTMPETAPSAEHAATGMIEGTPLLLELQSRGVDDIAGIKRAVARRVAEEYGEAPVQARMQAFMFAARRP